MGIDYFFVMSILMVMLLLILMTILMNDEFDFVSVISAFIVPFSNVSDYSSVLQARGIWFR